MKAKLTDLAVDRLKPPAAGRVDVFDAVLPGFGVRVSATGRRSWFVMYRHNGKQVRQALGEARRPVDPEGVGVSLAEARDAARKAIALVDRHEDPRRAPAEVLPAQARESFASVAEDFLRLYAVPRLKGARAVAAVIHNKLIPVFGSKPITTVTRRDVLDVVDTLAAAGKGTMANRTLAYARKLFNWAVERGVLEASPLAGVGLPSKEQSRDRVLDDRELAGVWEAAGRLPYPWGSFVRLAAITGQRPAEIAGMRRGDLDGSLWSIPDPKNATPHLITLPPAALAVLAECPELEGPFVLSTTGGGKAIRPGSNLKAERDPRRTPRKGEKPEPWAPGRLDKALAELHAEDPQRWPLPAPWRLYDLRRTAASGMARLGVAPHVIERVLNHRSGQIKGVARVYNRFDYREEVAHALRLWAHHVEGLALAPAPGSTVVALRRS